MEMQCRQRDGISWMRDNTEAWTKDSFFQVHNWWHLALFHYELGEIDQTLALFDAPIYGVHSTLALNMLDASALLWRLHLRGVDVDDRWTALAANWAPKARDGNYAFNDAHAMMAFVGAGLEEPARLLLEAQEQAMAGDGDNAGFTRDVGYPVTRAIKAFGDGDYAQTVTLLQPDPQYCLPLRRQPCAARRDRPDVDRGGVPKRRSGSGGCPFRRTRSSTAEQPAVAAFHEARSRDARAHTHRADKLQPFSREFFRVAKKMTRTAGCRLRRALFCAVGFARRKRGADLRTGAHKTQRSAALARSGGT